MAVSPKTLRRAGIGAIVFLGILKFFVFPLSDRHADMAAENRLLAERLARQKSLWANRKALESSLTRQEARLAELKQRFPVILPPEAKRFQLQQQQMVESLVTKAGVHISSLTWLPVTAPFFQHIPVKIMGEGTPGAFYQIVKALESRKEFITVNELSFRRQTREETVRGELVITFYALDPGRSAGEAP